METTPQGRSTQVLRGEPAPGCRPDARLPSQTPPTLLRSTRSVRYRVQGLCCELCTHQVFGVSGRGTRSDGVPVFRAESEFGGTASEAYVPPPWALILSQESIPDRVGLRLPGGCEEPANHRAPHGSFTSTHEPRLTPQTSAAPCPPLGTPLSAPSPSLRCWGSPSWPLSLREKTRVRKSWESHLWLL